MHLEIKENFQEKLRLVVIELVSNLDNSIRSMLAEHSAKGLLRSGATIKRTMEFITQGNKALYEFILNHLKTLDVAYYPAIESDIHELARTSHESFKSESLPKLKKSTDIAGKPNLYERMLPEVESGMANDLANFHNSLNAAVVKLKLNRRITLLEKAGWGLEAILLLASMFVAGMWYKDPNGNYEPVLVGLGLVIPLIAIGIKYGVSKVI